MEIPFDISNLPDAQQAIIRARHAVVLAFAAEKGKAPEALTMEEVMECRRLPEWQNAGKGLS